MALCGGYCLGRRSRLTRAVVRRSAKTWCNLDRLELDPRSNSCRFSYVYAADRDVEKNSYRMECVSSIRRCDPHLVCVQSRKISARQDLVGCSDERDGARV